MPSDAEDTDFPARRRQRTWPRAVITSIVALAALSACSLDFDDIRSTHPAAGADAAAMQAGAGGADSHDAAGIAGDMSSSPKDSGLSMDARAQQNGDAAIEAMPDAGSDASQADACTGEQGDAAFACVSKDPCEPNPCSAHASCAQRAAAPGYACTCAEGYELSGKTCVDIDECSTGAHTCHPSSTCKNNDGGYDCTCPLGYAGGTPAGFACTPRIAVSYNHTCALLSNGHISCWGDNSKGQLGDGTMANSTAPVAVMGISNAVGIEAGALCTCAVLRDGTASCWGSAVGATDAAMMPQAIAGIDDAVMLSTDCQHTCIVRHNGHVACFGHAQGGALGNGDASDTVVSQPADVPGISSAIHVSTTYSNPKACATLRNGSVNCWGSGNMGDGSASGTYATPVTVSNLSDAIATAQAYTHTCALRANGWVVCWGQQGLDGNGTLTSGYDLTPVLVSMGCRAISLELYDSCLLRSTGGVDCWGTDAGDSPTPVSGISNAVAIASEGTRGCALLDDGTIFCFTAKRDAETAPNIDLW